MRYIPGTRLVILAAALALLAGGGLIYRPLMPAVGAGWALLLIPAVRDILRLRKLPAVMSVELSVPVSVIRGESIAAKLRVYNGADWPLRIRARPITPEQGVPPAPSAQLGVLPRAEAEATFSIATPTRGDYVFGAIYLRVTGPWRLVEGQFRVDHCHVCKVYPNVRQVKEYLAARRMRNLEAPHVVTSRLRGIGSEFESLRDYETGDDVRRIDWKATAKHAKFIVRNYEIEHFRNVMVVIDRGRLMAGRVGEGTKLDTAFDAALMIAGVALDSGDRFGVMVFDDDVTLYLPPRGGMARLHSIVEALYHIQPTLTESHFRRAFIYLQTRLTKRSLVIVLTDVIDRDASAAFVTGAVALAQRHLLVCAALRTPEIEAVISEPAADLSAPYRKAVAYRLMKERSEVMAQLSRGGAHVLDIRPQSLTVPLVNKYIELREQNLL